MQVVMAQKAGFCMGVRRAVQIALRAAGEAPPPVYTYGPLIHNSQALMLLETLNVYPLKEIPSQGQGTIIIRAHGIPPQKKEALKKAGFHVIDGTCPRVLRVQALARRYSRQGFHVIIVGDPEHAEVKGLLGYAGNKGLVISSPQEIDSLPPLQKYVILSQTTQDTVLYTKIVQELLRRFPGGKVYNTICNATHERQKEVRRLCKLCEAIVVVGGKNSANTKRLAQIAQQEGREVFLVETAHDLPLKRLQKFKRVGVTAGASTPNWVINQVIRTLENLPSPYEPGWKRWLRKLLRFCFESNLALGLGIFVLTLSNLVLMGLPSKIYYPLMASCFCFGAHTLNRLMDIKSLRLNDPFRAQFLEKYRPFLLGLSLLSYLITLFMAWTYARSAFGLVVFLTLITIIYSLPFFSKKQASRARWFPGARSLFIALAWMSFSTLVPWISENHSQSPYVLMAFSILIAFMRAVFLEILEVQGDGFVGKETLPVFIGEKKTFQILYVAIGLLALVIVWGIRMITLLFIPVYCLLLLNLYRKRLLGQSLLLEGLTEALPITTGIAIVSKTFIYKHSTQG